ncbi:DUF6931 family protein [Roseospira visakhapatnamensis]|uniref:Uncharacterized protein n=1 Tax=Roseospira visakhapatnamensis TaxID=390880 RepID=A0A7W6RA91_9PROT|nr:hypothetical protein [Roseospira visakhapatnamensis]MBB4264421.1 hypothetical protein [Roseospira visakhapatnamensis]
MTDHTPAPTDPGPLSKIPATPLGAVLADLPEVLAEVAAGAEEQPPAARLRTLLAEGQTVPALLLLAHALPPREAIWWACLNARAVLGETPEPKQGRALAAAEAWVYQPDEAGRRACQSSADAAGNAGLGAICALAVFFSGDTLSEPDLPKVAPPPGMVGTFVTAALHLAAVQRTPERAPERLARAVRQGIDIANGGNGRVG